ncbi:Foldase protein PrsA 2 precursor [compost metagenome]|uniref:peptidylprolyl isomerase n=1 Tax=Achromobacter sp. Root83 TaxID=1736602 RepID=UPI00070EED3D|nr:peptidylprolyl isomerase [Achromobacter sp. Root83]KRC70118.1 peptidylprolyl isomerase [Achromobacter sp. Root83]
MSTILKSPTALRVAGAVLTVTVLAGAVALMRGNDAQSSVAAPVPAAAKPVAAAPAPSAAPPKAPAIATLGAVQVDRDELLRQLQALPPQSLAQLKDNRAGLDQWLRARLAEKALIEQARAQGWQDQPEQKRAFQAAQERILLQGYLESVSRAPDDYPGQADLQAAYERAKPQLAQPAMYRISQIFLPAALGDADAVAAARKQALDLVKRAQAPKGDFAALARDFSQDATTRGQGGDIGYTPLAQLTPEMRPAVEQLKAGEVSAPVQSAAGFHILKLADVRPASVAPFEQVKEELRMALRTQRQELAARAYLEGLLNAGTVSIDGAALNAAFEQTAAAQAANPAVARAP